MSSLLQQKRDKQLENRFKPLVVGTSTSNTSRKTSRTSSKPSSLVSTQKKKLKTSEKAVSVKPGTRKEVSQQFRGSTVRATLPRVKQLRALKVSDVTLHRYAEAVQKFKSYCKSQHVSMRKLDAVDDSMACYFADLCEEGMTYNAASYTLFGYILLEANAPVPEKALFPKARGALKGWSSRFPQSSRTGADPLIWYLLAEEMLKTSMEASAALLVQLDTYARPSEIVKLRRADVIRPVSKQCRFWGIIFGNSEFSEQTKVGLQDDTVLLDSFDRQFAATILELCYRSTSHPSDRLFPGLTLASYERVMKDATIEVGLGKFSFTPHGVRHTGPSIDFLQKARTAEQIMARGRWTCLKSVQRYQKPGRMLARMSKIPQHIWDQAKPSLDNVIKRLKKNYGGKAPGRQCGYGKI